METDLKTETTKSKSKAKTPLFNWLDKRAAGVLLHPTSLPGEFGIGTLGKEAREAIDFMKDSGLIYWQVCPLGPTGFGDSPYQCFSAFAGNPYLIDLDELIKLKLISYEDTAELRELPQDYTDFGGIYNHKRPLLKLAWKNFSSGSAKDLEGYGSYEDFKAKHDLWLDPYALFMSLKEHFEGKPWTKWSKKFATFEEAKKAKLPTEVAEEVENLKFQQYLFFGQWKQIKDYANKAGVEIIGDIPIFVSADSADIWATPEIFQLDKKGRPSSVAGVPPDYFSETGQLWGNPLYDWKKLKEDKYDWWVKRFELNFELFDVVRLDHFRGFYNYWKIPAKASDARKGKWAKGPGMDFFKAVKDAIPDAKIIAEDLGDNMDKVFEFRDKTGLPGMSILQFAFYPGDKPNPYLPENMVENAVVYPGTHDNNTTLGWYNEESEDIRHIVRTKLGVSGDEIAYDFIRCSYATKSRLAVIPMQDFMSIGAEGRFNTPGLPMGNWQWRYSEEQLERLQGDTSSYLRQLAVENKRLDG